MTSDVKVERHGAITVCTIDRAEQKNSINAELYRALLEAYRDSDADPECRVIITRAAGKHFSVGANSADLEQWAEQSLDQVFMENFAGKQGTGHYGEDASRIDELGLNRWAYEVSQIGTPMVASIRGLAVGGGLGLTLLQHFRIADDSAYFSAGFSQLGLAGELGVSYLLPQLIGQQMALEVMIANRSLDAETALSSGLIDRLVDSDRLEEETMAFAQRIAAQQPLSVRASLKAILAPRQQILKEVMKLEFSQQRSLWSSADFQQSVQAMLEKMASK